MTQETTPLVTDELAFGDEGPFFSTIAGDVRNLNWVRDIYEAERAALLKERDEAVKLSKDAVDLIKVLANQIHGLPPASVSALSVRTFNEMFDIKDGAAYGQAKAIVDRFLSTQTPTDR